MQSDARCASTSPAKGKYRVGHSPTQRKFKRGDGYISWVDLDRLALSSMDRVICTITYVNKIYYSSDTCTRVIRAPRVGHLRPCHMASEPRRIRAVVPRATSARRHVRYTRHISIRGLWTKIPPLFRDLTKNIIKNQFKNQIKIGKRQKLQKFIIYNIQLLFNPNFLHWITNFFLFNIMSFKIYIFKRRN